MPTFPAVMPGGPAAAMLFEHLADADAAALKRLLFAMCVNYVVDFQRDKCLSLREFRYP